MTKQLELKIGTSANFIELILTKDVSTLEAIYDLIDNSIDAARNDLFLKNKNELDKFGLPKSYKGYEVYIDIKENYFSITDNCFGVSKESLINKTFVIAEPSNHDYGIGQYGIGLKRSLLKIGNKYSFKIDNGQECYVANFDNHSFGIKKNLIAEITNSTGKPYTFFAVSELKDEVKKDILNKKWIDKAIQGLQDRYSIYFSKGFSVSLRYLDKDVLLSLKNSIPSLRTDGKFLPKTTPLTFGDVNVTIESGIHEQYYFPTESKYSLSINRKLTNDFGIYFICNDRVIVKSSTEQKHGWKTKWHSEYNGFVCLVRFTSKDPSNLPWNTAKSAMREDASLFLDVIEEIQPIADNYRSEIKNRYIKNKDVKTETDAGADTESGTDAGADTESGTDAGADTESGTDAGADTESGTDAGADTESGTDAGADTESGTDAGADTESGTDAGVETETERKEKIRKERLKKPQLAKSIVEYEPLVKMINRLDIAKFNNLYKSLLDIDPQQHTLLTIVGIWSFLDSLARIDKAYSGDNFSGYFNGKLQHYPFSDKEEIKVIKKQFEWFMHEGNFNKHDKDYATLNGIDVVYKFNKLQPVIAHIMEMHTLKSIK
ncbi:hypothetical protein B9T33_02410 [Acinetobacter sp. ANC 5054]|uniref:ATP-binding protein n=1 Tax=Acinetobacter sp. ANC 5054 TaxID=1977877 RepID=UPI000A33BD8C|nr:ATP-binding protein [Acinetobacter sp. ANC 5054]OTG83282.1 hypothetical protein B9T33_02410 [Acinetobacter sp. ANC 5054]